MQDASLMMSIAVLGGTGKEGSGLAMRWALSGYRVIIGSRDAERAQARAAELNEKLGGEYLVGMSNADAAAGASIVVLSVPYSAHRATLESVKDKLVGKVLVDVTVPLMPPDVTKVHLPEGRAAVLEAQEFLGDEVRVVAAFQHISSEKLKEPGMYVDCDVLICTDDSGAREETVKLVQAVGMRAVDAGPLVNAIAVEAMTAVLLYINRAYKVKGAGIRITGIQ